VRTVKKGIFWEVLELDRCSGSIQEIPQTFMGVHDAGVLKYANLAVGAKKKHKPATNRYL